MKGAEKWVVETQVSTNKKLYYLLISPFNLLQVLKNI